MARPKNSRKVPRVPAVWAHPGRARQEEALRKVGLTRFPPASEKIRCIACNRWLFHLWYDRCRCRMCGLYYFLEMPLKDKPFTRLEIWAKDGAVLCAKCKMNSFEVYQDRLKCCFCRMEFNNAQRLTFYWCMEDIGPIRKETYRQILGKSGIMKQIKKLKEKEGLREKKVVEPIGEIEQEPVEGSGSAGETGEAEKLP